MKRSSFALALATRDYRRYLPAYATSLIGSWMTGLTVGWLVYDLTGSIFQLALAGFSAQIPTLLLAGFSGRTADHGQRQTRLLWVQYAGTIPPLAMAGLSVSGNASATVLLGLTMAAGIVTAFEIPLHQTFVAQTVSRDVLPSAVAMNSLAVNLARLCGPALAGLMIHNSGAWSVLLLSALSRVPLMLTLRDIKGATPVAEIRVSVKESLRSTLHKLPEILPLVMLMAILSVTTVPFTTLLPAIAKMNFGDDSRVLGYLAASAGLGGLTASIVLGVMSVSPQVARRLVPVSLAAGPCLAVLPVGMSLVLSLSILFSLGAVLVFVGASIAVVLQTLAPDQQRGRIMAMFAGAMATVPLGSLAIGTLASRTSVVTAFTVFGLLSALLSMSILVRISHATRSVLRDQIADTQGSTDFQSDQKIRG